MYITVEYLRRSGYKVAVHHHRNKNKQGSFSPKGGKTVLTIDSPRGERFIGIARCSSEDNYDKKLGIRIAIGRSGIVGNL